MNVIKKIANFFKKLSFMQKLEGEALGKDINYQRILTTAIVTARNAPSHERVITMLEHWGVAANKLFFRRHG